MKTARAFWFFALLVCFDAAAYDTATQFHAGFREVAAENILLGIWYPSKTSPAPMRLGPFDVVYAENAPPAAGTFGVVIISHGLGGRYRNHHPTAALLAKNGFIVVAPQHDKDAWIMAGRAPAAVRARVGDIGDALHALAQIPEFRARMDAGNINAVGYSLGGATLIAAGGVAFNLSVVARHCYRHRREDEFDCGAAPWWMQLWQMFKARFFPRDDGGDGDNHAQPALQFRKVVLAAPVGQVFAKKDLAAFDSRALILRFKNDQHVRYPYHAEYLRAHLPHATYAELDAHHDAFIAPFPVWLTQVEDIPVAKDPPGFDRAEFLEMVNIRVLNFLRE